MAILTKTDQLVRAGNATWSHYLKTAVRSPAELADRLKIPVKAICGDQSCGDFPLFVPEPFLGRMEVGNINDPLLRQVLPIHQESVVQTGYTSDPLQESEYTLTSGLLKKYKSRALLMLNGTCAVHCRYCFRRHFPYPSNSKSPNWMSEALTQIKRDTSIQEVILSGGDPLSWVDGQIEQLVDHFEAIPHVCRLRIHSRLPIVIPARITERLVKRLGLSHLQVIFVVHSNHANELDHEVALACDRLKSVSTVLNQSVLLSGVNDSVESLIALSERLLEIGVMPYYLHQLDAVEGAAHFLVPVERGIELIREMRATTSGFLVPRYVQEIPGEPNKVVLA
ncbi:MAG: EF-P beta-lysylation protein EpmB [Planctomycetota bacterium]